MNREELREQTDETQRGWVYGTILLLYSGPHSGIWLGVGAQRADGDWHRLGEHTAYLAGHKTRRPAS